MDFEYTQGSRMSSGIKPIETVYNGYRFRSRLEARWAVFFDALGVRYEYEPEGYDLGEAGWYLPDFWLPEQDHWLEVKREGWEPDEAEQARLGAFIAEGGWSFYLISGEPYHNSYEVWRGKLSWDQGSYKVVGVEVNQDLLWTVCPLCGTQDIRSLIGKSCGEDWPEGWGEMWLCMHCDIVDRSHPNKPHAYFHKGAVIARPGQFSLPVAHAYTTARQARFEHGAGR